MPYSKPQRLEEGWRLAFDEDDHLWYRAAKVVDDVAQAATFLKDALAAPEVLEDWSKAALAVDPAGPWWCKTRDELCGLDDQQGVLGRLVPAAERAALAIQTAATDEEWQWLWSEPSFATPGDREPQITRPDFVAGLSPKRCHVIDIKTTSGDLASVALNPKNFDAWTGHLGRAGFDVRGQWVLAVATLRTAAADETLWIPAQ